MSLKLDTPRFSPGGLLLRFRQKFEHGLTAAYYRDTVRPRILFTAPVTFAARAACEIHVLTSSKDWLNLMWTLKSFAQNSAQTLSLCIHDDGSLPQDAIDALRSHFINARLIQRLDADRTAERALAGYPRCLQFRRSNCLAPKIFDFSLYLEAPKMLLLDSDILFFSEPVELLRRATDAGYRLNSVNPDVSSAYTVAPNTVKSLLNLDMPERFNSGLGVIHRESLRLDWIEEFLGLPGIEGHFWKIEQTLFALCSARFGVELLPKEYAVELGHINERPPC